MEPSTIVRLCRSWARASFALDLRSLAAWRIALGVLLMADAGLRGRDFGLMHTAAGMFPPDALRAQAAGTAAWSLALLHDGDAWAAAILALEGASGMLLASGLWARAAALAGWVAVVSLARRTPLASNLGDAWLGCQLLWCSFLPLGARWSCGLGGSRRPAGGRPETVMSIATVAVVLQLAFVYLGAGLGKCNAAWWRGHAVSHALSIHDHGTAVGQALAGPTGPISPAVPVFEISLALGVLAPGWRIRSLLIAAAGLFHGAIWVGMSVGLFAPIALAAWLPLVPAEWWRSPGNSPGGEPGAGPGRAGAVVCTLLVGLAAAGLVEAVLRPRVDRAGRRAADSLLAIPLDLAALRQDWEMFGDVPAQEQWVRGRAVLADGREVDILRGGRPCGEIPPEGGFLSLPNYRWRATFQALHDPRRRPLAPGVAAGLVRQWNAAHDPAAAVRSLEVLFGRRQAGSADTVHELVIATWPPRTPSGGGGLERLLDDQGLH